MKEKTCYDHMTRVGTEFNKELELIKEARINTGIDKKKKSTRKLTDMIIKHENWPEIRKDLIKVRLEGREDDE